MQRTPFSTFTGSVKSLRFGLLDETQRMAAGIAFGEFFREEKVNDAAVNSVANIVEQFVSRGMHDGGHDAPFRYRRFAGDAGLSRGSYYSITDEQGSDESTLVRELISYVDHSRSGRVVVFDSANAGEADRVARSFHLAPFPVPANAIIAFFFHDEAFPSPLISELAKRQRIPFGHNVWVAFPYNVEHVTIPNVIDLRRRDVQFWLYERVTTGLPGVVYYYESQLSSRLILQGDRVAREAPNLNDALTYGASETAAWYPPRVGWDFVACDGPASFLGLLPFLVAPFRGGTPVTDAIGRWLRQIGAKALIYPSARTDVTCAGSGSPGRSVGWNLVNYSGSVAPESRLRIIASPDSWWGLPEHTTVQTLKDDSWQIVGTARSHLEDFVRRQTSEALKRSGGG